MQHRCRFALLVLGLLAVPCARAEEKSAFPLRDGDVWVMAGDSITAQHLHSNYFEAFCYARYPKMKFAFRNSGVGGHTIPSTLARFDYDIAGWKPTVVSVELGMNDQGGTPTPKFIANMTTMVERIRSIKARPVIFSASPINDGTTQARMGGGNKRLDEYATALKDFCAREEIPYADQYHALLDVWGKNKPREILANNLNNLQLLAKDDSLAGADHLRAFLAAQEQSKSRPVSMQGDPVHPGQPGQLMMAAALLKALHADAFVSNAILEAEGKVVTAKGCEITNVKAADGTLSFDRLDECLPFPIPDEARGVLTLDPTILELSRYELKVAGLKDGDYLLKINGVPCGKLTAKALKGGVNLTRLPPGGTGKAENPITQKSKAILNAVAFKEGYVSQWRGLSQQAHARKGAADVEKRLNEVLEKVHDADARIRAAARPQKLHFELTPAS